MGNHGLEINLQKVDNEAVESPASNIRCQEEEFDHLKFPRYHNSKKSLTKTHSRWKSINQPDFSQPIELEGMKRVIYTNKKQTTALTEH